MSRIVCHGCGAAIEVAEPVPRDLECPRCGRDARCCRNCRHYDPALNNACRETEADPVEDKERRNFCEFFAARAATAAAAQGSGTREAEARTRLASLFGGGSGGSSPEPSPGPGPADRATRARDRLNALFRKDPEAKGSEEQG